MTVHHTIDYGNNAQLFLGSKVFSLISKRGHDHTHTVVVDVDKQFITDEMLKDVILAAKLGTLLHMVEFNSCLNNAVWDDIPGMPDALLVADFSRDTIILDIHSNADAVSKEMLDKISGIRKALENKAPVKLETDHLVRFWYHNNQGPSSFYRRIKCHEPDAIMSNYPATTRDGLRHLFEMKEPWDSGKIILWHGPPGTGKTHAIRALVHAWSKTPKMACSVVQDADRFFSDISYMYSVVYAKGDNPYGDEDDEGYDGNLIVLEDSADYILQSSRKTMNAAMSKLLNFSDGLLSQSTNLVFLITTNEPIKEIDPAIVRPGRCLQNLVFPRFTDAIDIDKMLIKHGVDVPDDVPDDVSLAELYQRYIGPNAQPQSETHKEGTRNTYGMSISSV